MPAHRHRAELQRDEEDADRDIDPASGDCESSGRSGHWATIEIAQGKSEGRNEKASKDEDKDGKDDER